MSSSRYDPGAVRERTQLFANARPYSPSLAMRASPNSARESPAPAAYNDAVYDQLESQHDEQIGGLSAKVSVLKDLSQRIGTEVREGTSLLGSLEDRFSNARTSVRNTMTRMIQTADRRGVSWRSWLTLIGIILFCFWLVRRVDVVEAVEVGAVDVNDAQRLARRGVDNRHNNLALRVAVAGNVPGELVHVAHELHGLALCGRAAHAAPELDGLARGLALERAERQLARRRVEHVEPGPVHARLRARLRVEVVPQQRRRVREVRDPALHKQRLELQKQRVVALDLREPGEVRAVGVHHCRKQSAPGDGVPIRSPHTLQPYRGAKHTTARWARALGLLPVRLPARRRRVPCRRADAMQAMQVAAVAGPGQERGGVRSKNNIFL